MREKSGNYHIVLLRTTNAMSVEILINKIVYRVIGGILEFKFFLGDELPETCIKKYHEYLNGYAIMPF